MFGHEYRQFAFNLAAFVVAGVVSFGPSFGLYKLLQRNALHQGQLTLNNAADRMIAHADMVLNEAADALANVAPLARNGCSPDLQKKLQTIVSGSSYLRSMVIQSSTGVIQCAEPQDIQSLQLARVFRPTKHKAISVALRPNQNEQTGFLQVRWLEGMTTLVAHVRANVMKIDILPSEWSVGAKGSLSLDDGTLISLMPHDEIVASLSFGENEESIFSQAHSINYPIMVKVSVPKILVLSPYSTLFMAIKFGGGILGCMFMAFVYQVLHRKPHVQDAMVQGIKNREFVPFFQPIINIQTGKLAGCEVLIRWRKKDGTYIPPGAFIQQAEESGLAVEMTRQLMRTARDELGAVYASRPELKMAFNLFADHFSDLSTVEDVRDIFQTGGIRYSQLVLEVTERYPLPNINRALAAIASMQELGCKVALDDAGTGHGGLAYLQKLGMDEVKIDKIFVDTITGPNTASPIVDSLIHLARQMSMDVVAEGVETMVQLDYLKEHGVKYAQGFLFAQALPPKAYCKFVEAMWPLEASNIVYIDVAS